MKITKSYLKQIIKEEIQKITMAQPAENDPAEMAKQRAEQRSQLTQQLKLANAQLTAARAAKENEAILLKQIQDIRDTLNKLG